MLPTTPSQTVGPFYTLGLCREPAHELIPPSDRAAVWLRGRLLDGEGEPVDGVVEVWDHIGRRWGRCGTDGDGRFAFTIARPAGAGADAPRLDVYVFARGLLKHQLTRIYFPDEPDANAADPVLSGLDEDDRATLIAQPGGDGLQFDIRMQGEAATVFFAV
jgi:protocatechuate 3,4-dioxygenase, alpha subunit